MNLWRTRWLSYTLLSGGDCASVATFAAREIASSRQDTFNPYQSRGASSLSTMSWGAPVSRQPRLQTPSARVGGLRPSLSPAAAAAAAFSTALSPPSRARTPSTACPRARTPGSRPNSGASGSRPISRGSHPVMANTQPGQARARRAGTTDILALGSEGLGRDIDRHEFNR